MVIFLGSPLQPNIIPDTNSCKSGSVFAGDTDSGKMHNTLVPGLIGGDSFATSVTDDDTGGVYYIKPDMARNIVLVEEQMQVNFPPELKPQVDGNPTGVIWSLRLTNTPMEEE